uniref:Ig-like domain-containing protein n=1 Tax=Pseudonaja textilis TaxID=8673 RepID=A0A670ZVR1_PSETE
SANRVPGFLMLSMFPRGSTVQISCTLSGDTMATHTISWFQHQLPNPPKYLLYYKDESNQKRKEGVSDRFAASKDASLNACYLTISEVQAADEATYYCLSSTGSE